MIIEITTIIFILLFVFIVTYFNNCKCQLTHIIIGLSSLVFYKLAQHINLSYMISNTSKSVENIEKFNNNDVTNLINDFISNNENVSNNISQQLQNLNVSQTSLDSYNKKLSELINAINDLKLQQHQQSNTTNNNNISPDNLQKLDLEAQQQYQMFQIDYLNKQLQNAKDMINTQNIAETTTQYKPIKVYSSCVISNADGTTSLDVPINLPQQQQQQNNNIVNNNTQNQQQILQTISQQQQPQPTNNNINLSNTGIFNNLINNLLNNNNTKITI